MPYVTPKEAKDIFNVADITLRRWEKNGKIKTIRTNGNQRRYFVQSTVKNNEKKSILYARVSSSKQKKDLQKQVKYLQNKYPEYEVIKDIGSGLNFKRKGFLAILERLFKYDIKEVVVAEEDRFVRFGFDFFEFLFKKFDANIKSINKQKPRTVEEEMSEDLISIITTFTSRYYGRRKYNIVHKKD